VVTLTWFRTNFVRVDSRSIVQQISPYFDIIDYTFDRAHTMAVKKIFIVIYIVRHVKLYQCALALLLILASIEAQLSKIETGNDLF